MIKQHPSQEQLLAFAEGSLNSAEALVVSAHCDMCARCQKEVAQFTDDIASQSLAEESTLVEAVSFSSMFDAITQQPASQQISAQVPDKTIELDGRKFTLPRTLRRYANHTGNWSKLVGKLWQAPVNIEGVGKANFIYMEKGGTVPEHTHKGNELTIVINGHFSDGMGHYQSGDFIAMNGTHTHAPYSNDDEGCLVFTIVDEPLHFTSGVARLLNPFSQLFF